MSAFAATALFNGFFQQGINADFQAAQQNLMEQERVRSASLEALGVPGQQAETLAILVNTSIDMAADAFDVPVPSPPSDSTTPLGGAFAKARLRVRVLDREGFPLAGAMVNILNDDSRMRCTSCPATTDDRGRARLRLRRLPRTQPLDVTLVTSVPGAETVIMTTTVVGMATIPVTISVLDVP